MTQPPAGWYPDPQNPALVRYFDGGQWTSESRAAHVPPMPVPPAPPAAAKPAGAGMSTGKKWAIGGGIAAAVLLAAGVGSNLGGKASTESVAPVTTVAKEVVSTPAPTPTPTPTPTQANAAPSAAPAPAPVALTPVAFRAQANSHLDDMNKDLDDIVKTVEEAGFWRLLSNSAELAFNQGQLGALTPPVEHAAAWTSAVASFDEVDKVLLDAVSTQDGASILSAVDGYRAQVANVRAVVEAVQ